VVVVIRSENPETAKAFATALGQRWEQDPKIEKVLYRINLDGLKNKGLLFLSPDDLTALRQKLETRQDLLRDLAASPTLENVFTLIDRALTSTMVSRLFTGELDEGETEEGPIDFTPLLSLLRSIVFLPMLICLGDHSVHFLARYEDERAGGQSIRVALERTMAGTGGAILAAALAVAVGFFLLLPTGFEGLMELGFLSGSGILLTALATFTLLPALLVLSERRKGEETAPTRRWRDEARAQYLPWIHQHPRATLATCGLLVGLSALGLGRVRCDFNLLHLQAAGTESATWMQKILASAKRSVLFEEVVAGSLDEVKRKSAALEPLPEVAGKVRSPRSFVSSRTESSRNRGWPGSAAGCSKGWPPPASAMRRWPNDLSVPTGES
jgi:hypothetical protein